VVAAVGSATSSRARRPFAGTIAIAIVAILIVGTWVVASRGAVGPDKQGAAPSGPAVILPAGTQAVSYHGVSILVPANWTIDDTRCGNPIADTVVLADTGPEATCLGGSPSDLTVVWMTRSDSAAGRQYMTVKSRAEQLAGQNAEIGVGTPVGSTSRLVVLTLPQRGVVVAAQAPHLSRARALVETARVVTVDAYGCAQHLSTVVPIAPEHLPGADVATVPSMPTTASLCRYSDGWLVRSMALSPPQMRRAVAVLNHLPEGRSHAAQLSSPDRSCATDATHAFILHFEYPSGQSLVVAAHIGDCSTLTVTNGARTTGIDSQLIVLLSNLAGYDGMLPSPAELR
jgi:hypothetical protein